MACLALALQPSNGPDILLQTREWFPPARALAALSAFRQTRLALQSSKTPSSSPNPQPSDDLDSSLGDDPLAASSGQLVVGVESKYRVVYRLVNGIYVIGVTTAVLGVTNLFDCINTVNQAVSILVAACRGVDVTAEKLNRRYPEIYMALDIVLRGVGAVRLAYILSSINGEGIAKMVHAAVDAENRVRGAESWAGAAEAMAADRAAALDAFAKCSFELPPETLSAGDERSAVVSEEPEKEEDAPAPPEKDPFAASEAVNKPPEEALVGAFKKTKDPSSSSSAADPAAALAGLDVTTLPPAAATKSTFIGVEGFEGDYGGIEFSKEEATLSSTFEGFNSSFGGGLDPSEFITTAGKKPAKDPSAAVLQLLTSSEQGKPPPPLENGGAVKPAAGPEIYVSEEISAEFWESVLARVKFEGVVFLRTGGSEADFSFKLETTPGVKRVAARAAHVSSLGGGLFHVRAPPSEDPVPLIKFSLQPRSAPIPLRVRMLTRHTGTLLSVLIQYAANPDLPAPLTDVTFVLRLPVDPTLLTVAPRAVLSREEREVRWRVPEVPLKGPPGRLRARMPVDVDADDGSDVPVSVSVKFSSRGPATLSGVSVQPAADGAAVFYLASNRYSSGSYLCT